MWCCVAAVLCCGASVIQISCQTNPAEAPKSFQAEPTLAESMPSKNSAESTLDYLNGLSLEIFSCSDPESQLRLTGEYHRAFKRLVAESGLDNQTDPPYRACGFTVVFFDGNGRLMDCNSSQPFDLDKICAIVAVPTGFGGRLMPVVTKPRGPFVVHLWL